ILEGTVRWEKPPQGPSRVRVTPQLIRVSDASHVWANVYDAVLADVFDVQSSIATQVAETLDVTLLAPERQAHGVRPAANIEAYDSYLRGEEIGRASCRERVESAGGEECIEKRIQRRGGA